MADFGLSEDVYTTGYFRQDKEDTVKLPFKWMAPESLMDSIFNEKTDVVGKGVCKLKTTCMLKTITFDTVYLDQRAVSQLMRGTAIMFLCLYSGHLE